VPRPTRRPETCASLGSRARDRVGGPLTGLVSAGHSHSCLHQYHLFQVNRGWKRGRSCMQAAQMRSSGSWCCLPACFAWVAQAPDQAWLAAGAARAGAAVGGRAGARALRCAAAGRAPGRAERPGAPRARRAQRARGAGGAARGGRAHAPPQVGRQPGAARARARHPGR